MVTALEVMPTRRLCVSLPPSETLRFVVSRFHEMGFSGDSWDLNGVLSAEGVWLGAIVRQGSESRSVIAGALVETVPVLLAIPRLRRQYGLIQIAIVVRRDPTGQGSEVLCSHISDSSGTSWASAKEVGVRLIESLADTMRAAGIHRSGPEVVRTSRLPDDHPFHIKRWAVLKREMKRRAKGGAL